MTIFPLFVVYCPGQLKLLFTCCLLIVLDGFGPIGSRADEADDDDDELDRVCNHMLISAIFVCLKQ